MKLYFLPVLLVVLVVPVFSASAQHPAVEGEIYVDHPPIRADVETRVEVRNERRETLDDRRENIQEHRVEAKTRIASSTAVRIEGYLTTFTRLLEAAIDRMTRFITRIEARADIMDSEGKDTAEARRYLDVAEQELENAEATLAAIKADLSTSLTVQGEGTRAAFKAAFAETKAALAEAKAYVRAAHEAIRNALASLRGQVRVEGSLEVGGE